MDAERYARVRALFDAVAPLETAQRHARLHELGADDALIGDVLRLLQASERHDTEQLARPLRAAMAAAVVELQPGDQLGAWRVEHEIGHGGMGAVFLVERSDGHFQQTAALKFIKGSARADAFEDFARERQLLASLAHPQIARLLDGGATAQGQPYLVMEYIDGVPIDEYCRAHALGRAELLDLFASACAAVAFAHRQLIVHCDLKPSNLLVTTDGRPILLDFGIAQLIDRVGGDAEPQVLPTPASAVAYTPRYASPEQRDGARVTTASDIFSLGIVLRELLQLDEQRDLATRELQALIAKATHVDPLQRYASVDALCDDIERVRARRPLRAMPASTPYRMRKFVMRRWPWIAAASLFVLTIAAFTGKVMVETRRAHAAEQAAIAERDRAIRAEAEARASEASALEVSEFLTSVFDGANPDAGTGNVPTAALLDQALHRVESEMAEQPATQAQLYAALGAVQYTIEQAERGRESFRRAIAIERTLNRPLVLAQMLNDSVMWRLEHFAGEDTLAESREALQLVLNHTSEDSTLRLDVMNATASVIGNHGDPAEATALFEQAISIARRIAPDSERLSNVLGAAGWHQRSLGHHDAAIALMRESAELDWRHGNHLDDDYFSGLETLAGTLSLARRFDESEQIFKRVVAARREAGRLETKYGAWSLAEYARMLTRAGRPLEAMPIFAQVFAIGDRKLADDGPAQTVWRRNFAAAAEGAGDLQAADRSYRMSIALAESNWGADDPFVATILFGHARMLMLLGDLAEAGSAFRRCVDIHRKAGSPQDSDPVLALRIEYARWLLANRQSDAAEAELAAVRAHRTSLNAESAARLDHSDALLLARRGDIAAALVALQQAEQAVRVAFGAHDARSWLIGMHRAELMREHGRQAEARALADEILAQVTPKLVPDSPLLGRLRALR